MLDDLQLEKSGNVEASKYQKISSLISTDDSNSNGGDDRHEYPHKKESLYTQPTPIVHKEV